MTVDESQAVDIELQPGEFSLHHVRLVHGSEPNRAAHRRVGLAIRYIPTRLRQVAGAEDSATLVRGTDSYNYFEHEPLADGGLHASRRSPCMPPSSGWKVQVLYRGTGQEHFRP